MSALSALSASSFGSDLETSAEKKAKSVVKCVPARGRGKKYVSVTRFDSTEEVCNKVWLKFVIKCIRLICFSFRNWDHTS